MDLYCHRPAASPTLAEKVHRFPEPMPSQNLRVGHDTVPLFLLCFMAAVAAKQM